MPCYCQSCLKIQFWEYRQVCLCVLTAVVVTIKMCLHCCAVFVVAHLLLTPCIRRRKVQMDLCLALDRRNSAYLWENSMSPSSLLRSKPADSSSLKNNNCIITGSHSLIKIRLLMYVRSLNAFFFLPSHNVKHFTFIIQYLFEVQFVFTLSSLSVLALFVYYPLQREISDSVTEHICLSAVCCWAGSLHNGFYSFKTKQLLTVAAITLGSEWEWTDTEKCGAADTGDSLLRHTSAYPQLLLKMYI